MMIKNLLCFIVSFLFFPLFNCFEISNFPEDGLFWHITDIHVDQNYSRTGNPLDLCHEDNVIHADNGLYGNFLCDAPQYLVNATVKSMKNIQAHPDFIVWTGDNLPHTINTNPDWNIVFEAINNVTQLLKLSFPQVAVFPSIGNHDTFPPNELIPNASAHSVYEDYLEKGGWIAFLDEEARETFIQGGFYSQLVRPGLRIVSLNTILWYEPNIYTEKWIDPMGQFDWLMKVLESSSKSSEKVYIIGHVPPGYYNRVKHLEKSDPTFHLQYLKSFIHILKKYADVIIGQLYGHLHMDMFQLFQCDTGVFVSSSLLASSVTPWHQNKGDDVSIPVNPSIRLMHYSHKDGLLKDYDQFFLNLTKANNMTATEEDITVYELLYTFTKYYDVPDLSTNSLVNVFEKLKEDPALFEDFYKFSTAGKESVPCDLYCKSAQLCAISCTSENEYNFCMGSNTNSTASTCGICDKTKTVFTILLYAISLASIVAVLFGMYICYRRKNQIRYEPVSHS